jgi:hypothetical protein
MEITRFGGASDATPALLFPRRLCMAILRAQVLKVGHHGSAYSSTAAFLAERFALSLDGLVGRQADAFVT